MCKLDRLNNKLKTIPTDLFVKFVSQRPSKPVDDLYNINLNKNICYWFLSISTMLKTPDSIHGYRA